MSEVPLYTLRPVLPSVKALPQPRRGYMHAAVMVSIKVSLYRGTSLIRNSAPLGPYSRAMPRALWWS